MGQRNRLLTESRINSEEQSDPQRGSLAGRENSPKQRPNLKRENEAGYETKNLPGDWIPPKDGGRREEDISQQRAERFEGGDEFGGTEEAQEPCEGQVVPIETHPRREDAVGE